MVAPSCIPPVQRLGPDDDLAPVLALLRSAFAHMEGRIDPPSSMTRIGLDELRAEAAQKELWVIPALPPESATVPDILSASDMASAMGSFADTLPATGPILPQTTDKGVARPAPNGNPIAPRACVILTPAPDHLYVGKLAVADGSRGQGLARILIDHADHRARALALALPELRLQVRVELTGNQAAFTRMGFREIGRTTHAGYARPTSITYARAVDPSAPTNSPAQPEA